MISSVFLFFFSEAVFWPMFIGAKRSFYELVFLLNLCEQTNTLGTQMSKTQSFYDFIRFSVKFVCRSRILANVHSGKKVFL